MAAPLSNTQKRYLSQLSDRAFNRLAALARGRGEEFPASVTVGRDSVEPSQGPTRSAQQGSTESRPTKAPSPSALRAAFRHDEVAKACGKLGLRCCSQDDYNAVKAHFLVLLGEDGRAFREHVRAQSNGRRIVEHKIVQALSALGQRMPYAESICRRMYHGTGLADATEKQLWKLFYALQYQINRGSKKTAEEQGSRGEKEQANANPKAVIPLFPSAPAPLRAPAPFPLCSSAPLPFNPSAA